MIIYYKNAIFHIAFVITIGFLLTSCGNNQKSNDSKVGTEQNNDANSDSENQDKDAQFLVNAAEINLEEIQLGRLAQQKGQTTDIKALGKMMEDAHTKSLKDLTALAISKRMSVPSSPTDDALDVFKSLNEYSGDEFDKAYADLMVSAHKDAIEVFEDASKESRDSDIKNWAAISLPELQTHLNHSINAQRMFATMFIEKNNQ